MAEQEVPTIETLLLQEVMVPIYMYICDCGNEREIRLSKIPEEFEKQICGCGKEMYRNYSSEGFAFGWGDAMARPETGFSKIAEQAEVEMKKRGLPVGHWVGKTPDHIAKKVKKRLTGPRKKKAFCPTVDISN